MSDVQLDTARSSIVEHGVNPAEAMNLPVWRFSHQIDIPEPAGTLQNGEPIEAAVTIVDRALQMHAQQMIGRMETNAPQTEKQAEAEAARKKEIDRLKRNSAAFVAAAEMYDPRIKNELANRLSQDENLLNPTMDERVQACMNGYADVLILTDFDDTVSENAKDYLEGIPASIMGEDNLAPDRSNFEETFVNTWQEALKTFPEAFRHVGRYQVKIRPGVRELFARAQGKIQVCSANFKAFLEGGLSQIPEAENVPVWSITENNTIATEKGAIIKHLAYQNPQSFIVVMGDGSSDIKSINDTVGVYFALENGAFHKELERQGKRFFTFKDQRDIVQKLADLGLLAPQEGRGVQ